MEASLSRPAREKECYEYKRKLQDRFRSIETPNITFVQEVAKKNISSNWIYLDLDCVKNIDKALT